MFISACANNGTPIGPCVNNLCPTGFTCDATSSQCCPDTTITIAPNACAAPIGPCVGNQCPLGFVCDVPSNQCCTSGTGGVVVTTLPTPLPTLLPTSKETEFS